MWVEVVVSAVASLLGGSAGASYPFSRLLQRRATLAKAESGLLRAAIELREAYRQMAENDGAEPAGVSSRQLEDRLDGQAVQALAGTVRQAVRDYVDVGRLYAARDQDTGLEAEQSAYDVLVEAASQHLKETT